LVVLTFKGGLLEHAFVVNDLRELKEDKRFWEVTYQDVACPELGLEKVEVDREERELACMLFYAIKTLFRSSSP